MRIWVTAMVFAALLLGARVSGAGVVLQQEQVATQGSATRKVSRTLFVEPKRAKIVTETDTLVVQFDKPETLMINPGRKTYYQAPFPPPEFLGFIITNALAPPMVNYKKTGKHRTISGYKCDEYGGSKEFDTIAYYDLACFSDQAPGAKEYDAFLRSLIAKLDRDPKKPLSKMAIPAGIPLETQSTIVRGTFKPPPAASGKPATPGAPKTEPNTPPPGRQTQVVKITVTSVKAQSFSPTEFEPPATYVQQPEPSIGLGR